jgi:hypothetical protein
MPLSLLGLSDASPSPAEDEPLLEITTKPGSGGKENKRMQVRLQPLAVVVVVGSAKAQGLSINQKSRGWRAGGMSLWQHHTTQRS